MRVAWLEQAGVSPEEEDELKHQQIKLAGFHLFRLNWADPSFVKDSAATIWQSGVTWAEGRNILFESARVQNYDYYIFVDDDLRLISDENRPYEELLEKLKIVRPETATIYSPTDWAHDGKQMANDTFSYICGHDLQVQIFSSRAAELLLPIPFVGSAGTGWYAQLLATRFWPKSHVCLNGPIAINTRSAEHQDSGIDGFQTFGSVGKVTLRNLRELLPFWIRNPWKLRSWMIRRNSRLRKVKPNFQHSNFLQIDSPEIEKFRQRFDRA